MFHFFPSQNLCDQNRPCNKLDEGQPKVMIYTNYDGSESLMLHTKLHFYWYIGSREEDFFRFLQYNGYESHLGHVI